MKSIFKSKVSLDILHYLYVKNTANMHDISKNLKIAYAHVHNTIKILKNKNLIEIKKYGRQTIIKPTKDGKRIGKLVKEIKEIAGEVDEIF